MMRTSILQRALDALICDPATGAPLTGAELGTGAALFIGGAVTLFVVIAGVLGLGAGQ